MKLIILNQKIYGHNLLTHVIADHIVYFQPNTVGTTHVVFNNIEPMEVHETPAEIAYKITHD